jgi:hypothetical protein
MASNTAPRNREIEELATSKAAAISQEAPVAGQVF